MKNYKFVPDNEQRRIPMSIKGRIEAGTVVRIIDNDDHDVPDYCVAIEDEQGNTMVVDSNTIKEVLC